MPRASQLAHPVGRLVAEDAGGVAAHGTPAGRERVGEVQLGGRRRGRARRPGLPAPSSSPTARGASATRGKPRRPARPRPGRCRDPQRRLRPPPRRARAASPEEAFSGSRTGQYRYRPIVLPLPTSPLLARARHRRASRAGRAHHRDRAGARGSAGGSGCEPGAGAGGRPVGARGRASGRLHRRDRAGVRAAAGGCSTWTRSPRRDRSRRHCTRPAALCERWRRCLAARPEVAFCGAAAAGPPRGGRASDGLLPVQQRRPSRRAQALDHHGAERVLVLDWDVHHGNGTNDIFHDTERGAVRQHPPVAAVPGHGAAVRQRKRRGRGLHGQSAGAARCRARRMGVTGAARGRADRTGLPSAACCSCRRASTPTATIRLPNAS